MAKKTRLRIADKIKLKELAKKLVDCPAGGDDFRNAQQAILHICEVEMQKFCSAEEIAVLIKFRAAKYRDYYLVTITTDGVQGNDEKVDLPKGWDKIPQPDYPLNRIRAERGSVVHQALLAYQKAEDAYKAAVEAKLADYDRLINMATYFEDVAEVWEEAEQLRAEICRSSTALVPVDPGVLARIRDDVERRKAQA